MQIFVKLSSGKIVTCNIELDRQLSILLDMIKQKGQQLEGHYFKFIHPQTKQDVQFDNEYTQNATLASMGMVKEITIEIIPGKMPPLTNQTNVNQQHQQIPTKPLIQLQPQPLILTGQQPLQNTIQQQYNQQSGYQQSSYPVNTLPQQSIQSSNNQLFQQVPNQTYQPFNQNQFQSPTSLQTIGQFNDPQVQPWQQQQQQWQQNTPPAQQQHYSPNQSIQQQVQPQLQELQKQINLLQTQLDHQNDELAWYKKFYEENQQLQQHKMISKLTLQPLIQQLQELVAIRPE